MEQLLELIGTVNSMFQRQWNQPKQSQSAANKTQQLIKPTSQAGLARPNSM